jgi:hypothetical protein
MSTRIDETQLRPGPLSDSRLEPEQLGRLASEHAAAYRSAAPFPHVVLDGLLPEALLDDVIDSFPDRLAPVWTRHDDAMQRKLQWSVGSPLPPRRPTWWPASRVLRSWRSSSA